MTKIRNSKGEIQKQLIGDISGTYFTYLRRKARERNLVFSLSKEYLWNLFLSQNKKCALTKVDLYISNEIKNNNLVRKNHTASLDRIDNSIGYIEGNVQWVHKVVNKIRREFSIDDFIYWCTLVCHANPERSSVNEIKVTENVQRLDGEDSTNNPSTSVRPHIVGEDIV